MLKELVEAIWYSFKKILDPYKPQILALWDEIHPHISYLIEFHNFLLFCSRSLMLFIIIVYLIHKHFLGLKLYIPLMCWSIYALSIYNPRLLTHFYDNWFAQIINTFAVWFVTALPGADKVSPDQKLCMYCADCWGHAWPLKYTRVCPDGGHSYPPVCSTIYFICAVLRKLLIKYYVLGGGFAAILNDISWITSLF